MTNCTYFWLCILSYLVSYRSASAALTQRRVATWNLQGSSARTEAKWRNNVRQLVTGRNEVSVLSLQEAGTPPASAELQGPLGHRLINPQNFNQEVREYVWNLGSSTRPESRYIYYTQNDQGANRVNLAIVTRERPDHVIILRPPIDYRSARPILGVQFQKDAYFTIHASANGGGDAAGIVNNIASHFSSHQQYDYQFMIMGDFNRSPANLRSSLARQHPGILGYIGIYSTQTPTQDRGGVLDYAVIGQYSDNLPSHIRVEAFEPEDRQLVSDHKPVVFDITAS